MRSALIAALAAPIREVAAQVGPGWSDEGDPTVALAEVRDLLADVSAAARNGWSRTADGWSGAGADGAADFVSAAAHAADRLAVRIDQLRASTAGAADAVAWARSRLKDIINRFEDRAALLEPRLDEPWAVDELRAEAQRALDEAVAVVDELRTELDGHAAAVAAPPATGRGRGGRPLGAGRVHGTGRIHCGSGRLADGLGRHSPAPRTADSRRRRQQTFPRFRCRIPVSSATVSLSRCRTAAL